MANKLIQQFFNILQAANVEAVKIAENGGHCDALVRSVFFASGATADGTPLPWPNVDVGDYLVWFTNPNGGETALLTRADRGHRGLLGLEGRRQAR